MLEEDTRDQTQNLMAVSNQRAGATETETKEGPVQSNDGDVIKHMH